MTTVKRTKDRELYERITGCENKVSFKQLENALRKGQDVYHCTFCGHFHRATPLGEKALRVVKRVSAREERRKTGREAKKRKAPANQIIVRYPLILKPPKVRAEQNEPSNAGTTTTNAAPCVPGSSAWRSVDNIAHLTRDWFAYRLEKAKRRIESGDPVKAFIAAENLYRTGIAHWFIVDRQIGDIFSPFGDLNPLHKSVILQNGERVSLETYYNQNASNIWSEIRRYFEES